LGDPDGCGGYIVYPLVQNKTTIAGGDGTIATRGWVKLPNYMSCVEGYWQARATFDITNADGGLLSKTVLSEPRWVSHPDHC